MTSINVVQVPFKTTADLIWLNEALFSYKASRESQTRAIQKIKAYSTRGAIPHCLEMTALLVQSILADEGMPSITSKNTRGEHQFDLPNSKSSDSLTNLGSYEAHSSLSSTVYNVDTEDLVLRTSYSTILVKFVNGLLDPLQQGVYAISLHHLATKINVPSHFVEMRHVCTHESMPSLVMLRLTAWRMLCWLRENYWKAVVEGYGQIGAEDYFIKVEKQSQDQNTNGAAIAMPDVRKCDKSLKFIKKYLKQALTTPTPTQGYSKNKKNDEELSTQQFNSHLDQINATIDSKLMLTLLIHKSYLLPHGSKATTLTDRQILGLQRMWGPFITSLSLDRLFDLWCMLFDLSRDSIVVEAEDDYVDDFISDHLETFNSSPNNEKDRLHLRSLKEIELVRQWTLWILENTELIASNATKVFNYVKQAGPCSISINCLSFMFAHPSSNNKEQVSKLKQTWEKFWIDKGDNIQVKELRDLQTKKRRIEDKFVLFEEIKDYEVTPFGVVP